MTSSYLITDIQRDEGYRQEVYTDTTGNLTWGYGHKLAFEPRPGAQITQLAAYQQLLADLAATRRALNLNPATAFWTALDDLRQDVVMNMAFNLGVGKLALFHKFLGFARSGEYAHAAAEMLDSLWATQVKGRATRLAKQMETGEHQP